MFAALSDPAVLDAWCTLRSAGTPNLGEACELFVDDGFDWHVSSFCWAMYLCPMKRFLETGERVPYARRLDA